MLATPMLPLVDRTDFSAAAVPGLLPGSLNSSTTTAAPETLNSAVTPLSTSAPVEGLPERPNARPADSAAPSVDPEILTHVSAAPAPSVLPVASNAPDAPRPLSTSAPVEGCPSISAPEDPTATSLGPTPTQSAGPHPAPRATTWSIITSPRPAATVTTQDSGAPPRKKQRKSKDERCLSGLPIEPPDGSESLAPGLFYRQTPDGLKFPLPPEDQMLARDLDSLGYPCVCERVQEGTDRQKGVWRRPRKHNRGDCLHGIAINLKHNNNLQVRGSRAR